MTYDDLVTAVSDYCENTFPTVDMNTMIKQAEQRIYNTVQIANLRRNMTGTVTAGNPYLSAPDDFLSAYSLAVIDGSDYLYLLNKDVNFIRESFPTTATADRDLPQYYALFGPTVSGSTISDELSFILGPTPDTNYTIELHYFYYPESITVASDGQTWLGDNLDSVLLYGSLVEGYTYMKGEVDMIAQYEKKYQEALAIAKRLGDGMERQDAYRSGQYRQKVT